MVPAVAGRARLRARLAAPFWVLALGVAAMCSAQQPNREFGVHEYVVESAQGSFDQVSATLETAAAAGGRQVLASFNAGTPAGCAYRARVFVLFEPDYAKAVMAANRKTGAFAVIDRMSVFEDERGVHVAMVNPNSIDRTILMDDEKFRDLAETHRQALRRMITAAVQGKITERQFGQKRSKGYISRTMGVMAGGSFDSKIKEEAVIPGTEWRTVAARVREGLDRAGSKWGMRRVYELEMPDYETVVFGTAGPALDTRSFDIVKAGSDESRKSFKYPGLAYAASYPIEVVVVRDGNSVKVRLTDAMYRMKMYFEDAGNWAFMKNMSMPGSIQEEVVNQIKAGLQGP